MTNDTLLICWFADLRRTDTAIVGDKNAFLGEMIGKLREAGINVPVSRPARCDGRSKPVRWQG